MFVELTAGPYLLRKIGQHDLQKVFEGLSDPKVIQYYGISYKTIEETQVQIDWFNLLLETETGIWWAICTPDDQSLLGACGLNNIDHQHKKAEIGYWLLPANWQKGIMPQVLPVVLSYAFNTLQLHRIEAVVETENAASKHILSKMHFEKEGTQRECEVKNGKYISLDLYALLNNE